MTTRDEDNALDAGSGSNVGATVVGTGTFGVCTGEGVGMEVVDSCPLPSSNKEVVRVNVEVGATGVEKKPVASTVVTDARDKERI